MNEQMISKVILGERTHFETSGIPMPECFLQTMLPPITQSLTTQLSHRSRGHLNNYQFTMRRATVRPILFLLHLIIILLLLFHLDDQREQGGSLSASLMSMINTTKRVEESWPFICHPVVFSKRLQEECSTRVQIYRDELL